MKALLRSAAIAFSMYSRVPVPQVAWEKASMTYVFFFFPWVGALLGGLHLGWFLLAGRLGLSAFLYAVLAVALTILFTGGIHLDGYMDAQDAAGSHAEAEKRLAIMKDPHTGAFSVMHGALYLLLSAGVFAQVYALGDLRVTGILCFTFVLSRALCALCMAAVPCVKSSGLAHLFQSSAGRRPVAAAQLVYTAAGLAAVAWLSPPYALVLPPLLILLFFFLSIWMKRRFGGITGDLAGFSLSLTELVLGLAIAVLGAAGVRG